MSSSHKGGCLCGAVRYETVGNPVRVSLCHCRYCQLRTGTAFGIGVYFNSEQVTFNEGTTDTYSYETESGNTTELSRCAKCGTTVSWTISSSTQSHMVAAVNYYGDGLSSLLGIAGATFNPPTFWYDVEREVFTRSQAEFCQILVPESFDESPIYKPVRRDGSRLKGGA